ncbi:MAG: DNA polymerase III subunit alpha [Planctomycetota bacterium]
MPAPRFTHLHVHSHYSLLDGVIKVPDLVRSAKDRGMKALALTDHGNLFGAIEFDRTARAAGIKPIIGMEAYITSGSRLERRKDPRGGVAYHLLLLAENEIGYRNLLELSSLAFVEGFYYKPRLDHEILAHHADGLIGLSACLAGEVNRALLHGEDERALEAARRYQRIFNKDRFFLEIQDNGLPEQRRILEKVPSMARELGIPLVATNDIHYLSRSDARAQEVHLCINTGSTIDDGDRMRFHSDEFYFRTGEEMAAVFTDFPEAITNTDEIASLCTFELEVGKRHLPVFSSGHKPAEDPRLDRANLEEENRGLFRELIERGFAERYPESTPELRERLEYEIGIIEKMGFVSYFLIVWDFIRFAREEGIPVGPGRGSAVGSVVSYCLGITTIDPIRHGLIFERFLNSDRISLPDIDIDFCMEGRDRVIEYVRDRYGQDRVCQIITFNVMAAKAVIRDVGRALGVPLKEVDRIAKRIPDTPGIKLEEGIRQEPELAELARDPRYRELFEIAQRLEGLNRHSSTHAAGVVISNRPLTEVVPLHRNGEEITTQFAMEDLERLGLLKMDFLGLKTLTILDRAAKIIREEKGIDLDIERIALDDPATYSLLARGDTKGVFQLESAGMRELLRNLQPDCFEDLIAVLALYRPGPLGSGMHRTFCERKHGREQIESLHGKLDPILESTNGVILYQEQVMQIAHDLAGFSMNEADSLRKAMGKKKPEILARFKNQFMGGAERNGIPGVTARQIFELIEHFARYGFNKSHSTAYAAISYRTAYLKANHPAAFLAAVLSCEINNVDKVAESLEECKRLGIPVNPPSIQRSGRNFTVRKGEIHYGLVAVKGIGERVVDAIVAERERGGPYRSIHDLAARVDPKLVNKTVLEQLIACGAFDGLGPSRARLTAAVKDAPEQGNRVHADRRAGQLSLFGEEEGAAAVEESYPQVPEWSELEQLAAEKASLGFYLSGHPLDRRDGELAPFRTCLIGEIAAAGDQAQVIIGGMISRVRVRQTRRGEPMAILQVEDRTGSLEVIVFPSSYREAKESIDEDRVLLIRGETEVSDERVQLRAEWVVPVEEAFQRLCKRVGVTFQAGETTEDELFRLKDIAERHRGPVPISLIFSDGEGGRWVVRPDGKIALAPSAELLGELLALLGEERIRVNSG